MTEEDHHLHYGTNKRKKKGRGRAKEKEEESYHHPRGRTNKPTTEQQRGAKGRGKAG
jgi:hypothetical protein